ADCFQFQLGGEVLKRRAELDSAALHVRKQSALSNFERALAFGAGADPAEPIELAAVGGRAAVSEAIAIIIIPIQMSGQTELMQVADTLDALSRDLALH